MDATISLRTFGHRNSWFSDRLDHLSVGNLKRIVLLLALAALGSLSILTLSYGQSVQPIAASLARLSAISALAQQMMAVRGQVEHFLASGDAKSYALSEQALVSAVNAIEQSMMTSPLLDHFVLSRLENTSLDYLNTFRSLGGLIRAGLAVDTQRVIRAQMDATALAFDQQTDEALQGGVNAVDETLRALSASVTTIGIMLLLALGVCFSLTFALVMAITHHSAFALHQIGQATQQIALGRYDTRIDLSGETNPDIVQLGAAFNRMTENLKTALQSESAANQQNRLQLMKLAHQERITAILEERQRIARELHDSVKQQLFSITLSAGAAINLLEHAPHLVRTHLEHIRQAGHNAQAEMTALLQELIPVPLQEKRLEDALLGYLNPLCETYGMKLLWRIDGTNMLTIAQEHALFRAVQEAASNVVRHSGATLLRVSFSFGLLTHVIIEDNGAGFVPEAVPVTSTGLSLMRTRLRRVGGRYELQTTIGMGTRLTILLDLRSVTALHGVRKQFE